MWQRFRLSVLFITHDIDESIFLSDKVYVMTAVPNQLIVWRIKNIMQCH